MFPKTDMSLVKGTNGWEWVMLSSLVSHIQLVDFGQNAGHIEDQLENFYGFVFSPSFFLLLN